MIAIQRTANGLLFAKDHQKDLANKFINEGEVPANKFLKNIGVPENKFLKNGGVPANKLLKTGRSWQISS